MARTPPRKSKAAAAGRRLTHFQSRSANPVGRATIGFLGPAGKKQIGVIGEPVNLAAYLCSQARAQTVLVDCGSFARAGCELPRLKVQRLRSKKPHQRIHAICLRYGGALPAVVERSPALQIEGPRVETSS